MTELSSGLQDLTEAFLSNLEFARIWQQNLLDWRTVEFTVSGQTPQERPFTEPLSTGGQNTLSQDAQAQAYGGNVMPAQRNSLVADQELDLNGGSRDFNNADPHPLSSLHWPLSQLADDAPEGEQSSRGDNLIEHPRFHHSSGAIVASVVENRKSHGSTSYDEDFGKALYEAAQKAALASPSSNTSLEGDGELEEDMNFNKFSKAVLGVPGQYATVPAFSRPTWRNGEPITLGIIFAARVHLLEKSLKREGIKIRTDTAFINDALCGFLHHAISARHGAQPAFLELMSERNFAERTTMPSAVPTSPHTQPESQSPDTPSDLDPSSRPGSITLRDSSSSREPTQVPKPQKKPVHSCPICAKHFSRSSTLSRHAQSHRGVRDHKCAVCLREFSRKDLLNRHMSLHDRGAKWVCGAYSGEGRLPEWGCGREFAREDDLKRHFGSRKGQLCRKSTPPHFQSEDGSATLAVICVVDNE